MPHATRRHPLEGARLERGDEGVGDHAAVVEERPGDAAAREIEVVVQEAAARTRGAAERETERGICSSTHDAARTRGCSGLRREHRARIAPGESRGQHVSYAGAYTPGSIPSNGATISRSAPGREDAPAREALVGSESHGA